jgi:23S rRNA (cytosine1962-C5)-methyltransferase
MELLTLVERAIDSRSRLLASLAAERTDAYRIFHGAAEGCEGLAIDRYGTLILAQSFREPLEDAERDALLPLLRERFREVGEIVFASRGEHGESREHVCAEAGTRFAIRALHRGQDPWLFLDFRAGRRRLRELARGRSVLNLFAYTCTAGVAAACAGASEMWNVDFSRSALEVGRRNAELNAIDPERTRFVQEDCLPVMRQLAGLPVKGRASSRDYARFEPRTFDVVVLDPPAWSKGPFGAVDVERDYASLFKPALLATSPGGTVIATNHVASVGREAWTSALTRCAEKAGRPLAAIEILAPDADFPSRDGNPPLKIAVCRAP